MTGPRRATPDRRAAAPPPEPVADVPARPPVALVLAQGGTSWHVRLAKAWLGVPAPTTMGLIYQAEGVWQGRYYVAQSPDPSIAVPPSTTRAQAILRVIDAWVAHVPLLG